MYTSFQIFDQVSLFLVGLIAGPSATGIFKLGKDASTILSEPATLLNQSIYPEFARLGSRGSWQEFKHLIMRSGIIAAGAGIFMLVLTIAFGAPALRIFFGEPFVAAYLPLVLLVGAAGLSIIGFPLDAAVFAMGYAGIPLRVSIGVMLVVQIPLLVICTRTFGPTGAAMAAVAASTATLLAMAILTAGQLRQRLATA